MLNMVIFFFFSLLLCQFWVSLFKKEVWDFSSFTEQVSDLNQIHLLDLHFS